MNKYISFASLDLSDEFDEAIRVTDNVIKEQINVSYPLSISWAGKRFKIHSRQEMFLFHVVLETAHEKVDDYINNICDDLTSDSYII